MNQSALDTLRANRHSGNGIHDNCFLFRAGSACSPNGIHRGIGASISIKRFQSMIHVIELFVQGPADKIIAFLCRSRELSHGIANKRLGSTFGENAAIQFISDIELFVL